MNTAYMFDMKKYQLGKGIMIKLIFCLIVAIVLVFFYNGRKMHSRVDEISLVGSHAPKLVFSSSNCNEVRLKRAKVDSRIVNYCAVTDVSGAEGYFSGSKDWKLIHTSLLVRHGDRTAINSIENSHIVNNGRYDNCIHSNSSIILQKKKHIESFTMKSLSGVVVDDALRTIATIEDSFLSSGELTSIGLQQHIMIGKHLRSAYRYFLDRSDFNFSNIYVRSTNYARTIQSAAALLSSLLFDENSSMQDITIFAHSNVWDDVMLGAANNFNHRLSYDKRLSSCPKLEEYEKQMNKEGYFPVPDSVRSALQNIFGENVATTYLSSQHISDLVDPLLVSSCHSNDVVLDSVCGSSGNCVTKALLSELMRSADSSYCESYNSSKGGAQFTRLAMYPFMKEILTRIKYSSASYHEHKSYSPIALYAGHDTVIAPTLAALGIYQDEKYCKWPGYASRLIFELWTPAHNIRKMDSSGHFVRVLYNGEVVTHLVTSCKGSTLCPIEKFENQISSLISPYASYNNACKKLV